MTRKVPPSVPIPGVGARYEDSSDVNGPWSSMFCASCSAPVVASKTMTLRPIAELAAKPSPEAPEWVVVSPSLAIPGSMARAFRRAALKVGDAPVVGPTKRAAAR